MESPGLPSVPSIYQVKIIGSMVLTKIAYETTGLLIGRTAELAGRKVTGIICIIQNYIPIRYLKPGNKQIKICSYYSHFSGLAAQKIDPHAKNDTIWLTNIPR